MARSKIKLRPHVDVAHLNFQQISQPSIDFLHLMVPKILPRQDFKGQGQYGKVK